MELTRELLKEAKGAKTVEELIALAKESGIELTHEQGEKYFAGLHKNGALADDELDNVAGGCSSSVCSKCGSTCLLPYGGLKFQCMDCGHIQ